jgi:hypothetical protein
LKSGKDVRLTLYHTGHVMYNFPTVVSTYCNIDVSLFPWDKQNCPLKFGSWAYNGQQLDIISVSETLQIMNSESEQAEWEVVSVMSKRNVEYYACCAEPFVDIGVNIKLIRKPGFYMLNLLLPCFVLIIIAHCAFILPVDSGEKLSLSLTILLALTVFQLVVADMLPQSNIPPLIGEFNVSHFDIIIITKIMEYKIVSQMYIRHKMLFSM